MAIDGILHGRTSWPLASFRFRLSRICRRVPFMLAPIAPLLLGQCSQPIPTTQSLSVLPLFLQEAKPVDPRNGSSVLAVGAQRERAEGRGSGKGWLMLS